MLRHFLTNFLLLIDFGLSVEFLLLGYFGLSIVLPLNLLNRAGRVITEQSLSFEYALRVAIELHMIKFECEECHYDSIEKQIVISSRIMNIWKLQIV